LSVELANPVRPGQVGRLARLGHPGPEVDPGREVLARRQQPGVAPDRLGPRLDGGAGDETQVALVVLDLERGEALRADVHRSEGGLVAALATDQTGGGGTCKGC